MLIKVVAINMACLNVVAIVSDNKGDSEGLVAAGIHTAITVMFQ